MRSSLWTCATTTGRPLQSLASKKNANFEEDLCVALNMLELSPTANLQLHDWGGVIQLPEDEGLTKLTATEGTDLVFSFTPWSDSKPDKIGGKEKLFGGKRVPAEICMAAYAQQGLEPWSS